MAPANQFAKRMRRSQPVGRDKIATPTKMEPASKLIRSLRVSGDLISAGELACSAWPEAVGKKVAAHTRAARMVRDRLIVEVEDALWQRQLFTLSRLILRKLERAL